MLAASRRIVPRLLAAALLAATTIGCAANTAKPTVSLRLSGKVKDAFVTVDDQPLGPVAHVEKRGVALLVGKHRVTVERHGYFPFDVLVDAREGGPPVVVDVVLVPVPD